MQKLFLVFIFIGFFGCANGSNPNCFVGVAAGNVVGTHDPYVTGAELDCNGSCVNLTLNVHNTPISIFLCDADQLCDYYTLDNSCGLIYDGLSMCCCSSDASSNDTYCNLKESLYPDTPLKDPSSPSPPIECYVGVSFPQATTTSSITPRLGTAPCSGECANISLEAYGNLYLCDPIQVCSGLQMSDSCTLMDQLLRGCCCSQEKCNYQDEIEATQSLPTVSLPSEGFRNDPSWQLLIIILLIFYGSLL